MKCKVCGAESGRYSLCRKCKLKKEKGLLMQCRRCGQWHDREEACPVCGTEHTDFMYEIKDRLISETEEIFYGALQRNVPDGYQVFPQINLAAFIEKVDASRYRNELFRNVDFLITDEQYIPCIAVEINDATHLQKNRRERDEKVHQICEEAGIPIMTLWTSYGVHDDYIGNKILELLETPVTRVCYSAEADVSGQRRGCYIASCVYGSYDCPEVWTLRRYRDYFLAQSAWGRLFIRCYYAISPMLVEKWGRKAWFRRTGKWFLDKKVRNLHRHGYRDTPYHDVFF